MRNKKKLGVLAALLVTAVVLWAQQPVSVSNIPHVLIDAGTAVIGHVIVDSGAITATLAAETTKVIGTVNVAAAQTIAVTNAGTFAVQSAATLQTQTDTTMVGGVNVKEINGVAPLMGAGNTGTGSPRVTIASDQAAIPVNAQPTPVTSGGLSTCYLTSAATTNATNCKSSAGQVYHLHAVNTTATLYYLRFYNLGSAPTCSSATGFIETVPIPASATGAGIAYDIAQGQAYGTGIGFCLTGGGSSTDNTSAATGVYLTILYK